MLQFQRAAEKPISLPMSSNDLEAQRAVVLSFRIQVRGCLWLLIKPIFPSHSGASPTPNIRWDEQKWQQANPAGFPSKQPLSLLAVYSEACPGDGWKLKGSKYVNKNSRALQTGHIHITNYTSQECYLLKCIWFSKVPDSASPFQDWNRMSSQSKQVVHL